jgi:hypothetical protein
VRGVGGSPPTPLIIKKPGCQGKCFDADFLEKDLVNLGSSAYSIRMKIENENSYANFFELTGKVITKIDGDCDRIVTSDGYVFTLTHVQDCCESVAHMKTIGDPQSLIGNTIKMAQEDVCDNPDWFKEGYCNDCHTWTVFTLVDDKGNRVDAYWLGESNGYYSESVSVFKRKIS